MRWILAVLCSVSILLNASMPLLAQVAEDEVVRVTGNEDFSYPTFSIETLTPYVDVSIRYGCVGELEDQLAEPCNVYFDCPAFRRAGYRLAELMALKACGPGSVPWSFAFQQLSVRGGNNCGYGHYQITCYYYA